jgi:hypothetical protein
MIDNQADSTAFTPNDVQEGLPEEIVRFVKEASPREQRAIIDLAEDIESEFGTGENRTSNDSEEDQRTEENSQSAGESDETPDDVPGNATLTIKEINDNRYYYWQWRDGDTIRSKYKGPVQNQ